MKKQIDNYKFDKILSVMGNEYGKIRKGDEDDYSYLLLAMEGNLLKLYRIDNKKDSYSAIKAIKICLFVIDSYINDVEYDLDKFLDGDSKTFASGLLMAFDPFTNDKVKQAIAEYVDINDKGELKKYFKDPIKCLLRIESSIELWTKEYGSFGYFNLIENEIGDLVEHDDIMLFTAKVNYWNSI